MDATMVAILKQVMIWLMIIVMTIIIMDRLSSGYLLKYLFAKIRKNYNGVLVRVWTISGIKYRVGSIIEKTRLRYKGTDGRQRMFNLNDGSILDESGVYCAWVFEPQNAIMNHKTKKLEFQLNIAELKELAKKGYTTIPIDIPVEEEQENPDINDMFYEECLMRPGKEKPRIVDWIIIGLCVLTILFLWYHDKQMGKHDTAIYNMCNMAYNNTVILLKSASPVVTGNVI